MFVTNSLLPIGIKPKELCMLSFFLKRYPCGSAGPGIVHLCQTSALKTSLKEEIKTDNIPCLPVQPLDQMMHKYIKSIKPFVDDAEFEKTKQLVKHFCENENLGKRLQELLQRRAKSTENWLADWWLATAYLEFRNPVIVYSSPGMVWPEKCFKSQKEQLLFTAYLIRAALDFNKNIEENKLPQEKLGGRHLLCMSQYSKIFGTCRIPKIPADELLFQNPQNPSRNVIVMYNNHLFNIPVFEKNTRQPLTPSHFYAMLIEIVSSGEGVPGFPIGILTTEHRDNWAKAYEEIKKDEKNKHNLEEYVEKALFVVCIDKPLTLGSGLNYQTKCSKLLLHGFGSRGNAGNRWYDKTIQFIVGAYNDGVGIAYEHSPAEGGPIGIISDFIAGKITKINDLLIPPTYPKPVKLEFIEVGNLKERIASAGKAVDKLSNDLDVYGWSFSHFGKEEIKKLKVSPDSFIQVGIQLAFYKLHKHPAAQYESGSLRKYIHGRTDIIRTCSEEVVNFCQEMTRSEATAEEKAKALRVALAAHKSYADEVIEGRGVDRHLLALKILAKLNNVKDAKIFSDVAYQRSTYFQLSTSNVPAKCDGFMVYGPLVEDGYACCYNPREHNINFGTSAWSHCKETWLNGFKETLEETLVEMLECLSTESLKSKL